MSYAPRIYFLGEAKQLVNGQVVEDKALQTVYDGKVLKVDERNNNKISHFTIKDKALGKLLTNPTSEVDLIERLKRDFIKGRRHSRSKSARSKNAKRDSARRKSARRKSARTFKNK